MLVRILQKQVVLPLFPSVVQKHVDLLMFSVVVVTNVVVNVVNVLDL